MAKTQRVINDWNNTAKSICTSAYASQNQVLRGLFFHVFFHTCLSTAVFLIDNVLTCGDVEPGDDIFGDAVKVLHQSAERVAVRRDL